MLKLNSDFWTFHNGGYGLKDERDEMRLSTALIGLKFEVENNGLKFARISSNSDIPSHNDWVYHC